MKTRLGLFILALFTGLFSCTQSQTIKEERKLTGFTGFELSIGAKVNLSQGPFKFEIEGTKTDLEKISTEVIDNILQIKTKRNFSNLGEITINISMPQIESISIEGSGDINALTAITGKKMELDVSGSGNFKFIDLLVTEIKMDISGSGRFETTGKGKGDLFDIKVSGSGKILSTNHEFKKVEIDVSGSGNAEVWATDILDCDISGSGKINYKGNPRVDSDISGSGNLKHIE